MNYINQATVAAALGFIGSLALAFGQPKIASTFTDPTMVNAVLACVTAVSGIIAAFSHPPSKPTP